MSESLQNNYDEKVIKWPREVVDWARKELESLKEEILNKKIWEVWNTEVISNLQNLEWSKINNAKDTLFVQIALSKLGYNVGVIDGIITNHGKKTSRTIEAIKLFQGKNWLKPDGIVGENTLGKMIEKLGGEVKEKPKSAEVKSTDKSVWRVPSRIPEPPRRPEEFKQTPPTVPIIPTTPEEVVVPKKQEWKTEEINFDKVPDEVKKKFQEMVVDGKNVDATKITKISKKTKEDWTEVYVFILGTLIIPIPLSKEPQKQESRSEVNEFDKLPDDVKKIFQEISIDWTKVDVSKITKISQEIKRDTKRYFISLGDIVVDIIPQETPYIDVKRIQPSWVEVDLHKSTWGNYESPNYDASFVEGAQKIIAKLWFGINVYPKGKIWINSKKLFWNIIWKIEKDEKVELTENSFKVYSPSDKIGYSFWDTVQFTSKDGKEYKMATEIWPETTKENILEKKKLISTAFWEDIYGVPLWSEPHFALKVWADGKLYSKNLGTWAEEYFNESEGKWSAIQWEQSKWETKDNSEKDSKDIKQPKESETKFVDERIGNAVKQLWEKHGITAFKNFDSKWDLNTLGFQYMGEWWVEPPENLLFDWEKLEIVNWWEVVGGKLKFNAETLEDAKALKETIKSLGVTFSNLNEIITYKDGEYNIVEGLSLDDDWNIKLINGWKVEEGKLVKIQKPAPALQPEEEKKERTQKLFQSIEDFWEKNGITAYKDFKGKGYLGDIGFDFTPDGNFKLPEWVEFVDPNDKNNLSLKLADGWKVEEGKLAKIQKPAPAPQPEEKKETIKESTEQEKIKEFEGKIESLNTKINEKKVEKKDLQNELNGLRVEMWKSFPWWIPAGLDTSLSQLEMMVAE